MSEKPGLHDTFRAARAMLAYQGNGCHSLGIELSLAGFLGAGRLLNGRMIYKVCAFYQFAALPDYRELREPLRALCADLSLKGSVLLGQGGHQRHDRGRARGDRRLCS